MLFIGVISASMDEARILKDEDTNLEKELQAIKNETGISNAQVRAFTNIFDAIDLEKDRELAPMEIEGAMDMLDLGISVDEMKVLYRKIDPTMSGVNLANFIKLVLMTPKFKEFVKKNHTSFMVKRMSSTVGKGPHTMTMWHQVKKLLGLRLSQHDKEDEAARILQRLWRRHQAQRVARQELATRRLRHTGKMDIS